MLPPDPIDDELAYHREQIKQQRLAQGDSPTAADAYARRRLGNSLRIQEDVRSVHPLSALDTLFRHVRFAGRSFLRHGGAYLLATAILALGIGLSVAMFSLVEAVVFAPLPYPQQKNIHLVWKYDTQTATHVVGELAYPELADLCANPNEIAKVALIPAALCGNGRVLQTGTNDPVQIESCPTTADLFQVLGIAPALGRDFTAADEAAGAAPVVILAHQVWRERFNANSQVIGQAIRLNGVGHTIIGVMPPTVDFPRGTGLWLPLRADARRGATWLLAVVRTPPNVSPQALQAATERTFQVQVADHLNQCSRTQHAVVTPLPEYLTGSSRPQLLLALIASVLLLFSACVSASNLFLSRSLVRRKEVATRTALGASTFQILAPFTVEGLLAATIATAAGSLLAVVLIRLLILAAPADIPRIAAAGLSPAALAFAAGTAFLATLACILGPALLLRPSNARTSQRLQATFVFAQTALTVAILAVGLLIAVSYQAMLRTDTGFANRETLTMNLALRGPEVDPAARRRFYFDLLTRLRAAPEVASAAAVLLRPFEGPVGWDSDYSFEFEGGQRDPHLLTKANFEVITPQYFNTVGTALLAGRDFTENDAEGSERVLIISQSLAARAKAAGYDPIGQRLRVFGAWRKVVGIVADSRYRRVVEKADDLYVPLPSSRPADQLSRPPRPRPARRVARPRPPNFEIHRSGPGHRRRSHPRPNDRTPHRPQPLQRLDSAAVCRRGAAPRRRRHPQRHPRIRRRPFPRNRHQKRPRRHPNPPGRRSDSRRPPRCRPRRTGRFGRGSLPRPRRGGSPLRCLRRRPRHPPRRRGARLHDRRRRFLLPRLARLRAGPPHRPPSRVSFYGSCSRRIWPRNSRTNSSFVAAS